MLKSIEWTWNTTNTFTIVTIISSYLQRGIPSFIHYFLCMIFFWDLFQNYNGRTSRQMRDEMSWGVNGRVFDMQSGRIEASHCALNYHNLLKPPVLQDPAVWASLRAALYRTCKSTSHKGGDKTASVKKIKNTTTNKRWQSDALRGDESLLRVKGVSPLIDQLSRSIWTLR